MSRELSALDTTRFHKHSCSKTNKKRVVDSLFTNVAFSLPSVGVAPELLAREEEKKSTFNVSLQGR